LDTTQPDRRQNDVTLAKMGVIIEAMDKKLDKVVECIDGNGRPGIKTEVALNKQAIRRGWWWLGGISIALVGIAGAAIKTIIGG